MPQNPLQYNPAITPGKVAAPLNLDAAGNLKTVTQDGNKSAFDLAADTLVTAAPCRLMRVSVLVAGAAGAVHDIDSIGAAAVGNQIGVIPAVVGVYNFNWPCLKGLVYKVGAAQVVSISYEQ